MKGEPADRHFGQKATWLNKSFKTFSIYAPKLLALRIIEKMSNDRMLVSQICKRALIDRRKTSFCLTNDFQSDSLVKQLANVPVVGRDKVWHSVSASKAFNKICR